MSSAIPDRWLNYKPYGDVIKGTNILAFKVPLKQTLSQNLDAENQFTPSMLLKAFPRLKYVIDLTNTNRYYNKNELTDAGLTYEKIMLPGRSLPSMTAVVQFYNTMDRFRSACRDGELVGVHCTHGVNRTGYLICRYLVQQLGWKYNQSLKAFEEARGYPIERELYVSSLRDVPQGVKIDARSLNTATVENWRLPHCVWNDDSVPNLPRFKFKVPPPPGIGPLPLRSWIGSRMRHEIPPRAPPPPPPPPLPPPSVQRLGFPGPNYPCQKPGPSRVPKPTNDLRMHPPKMPPLSALPQGPSPGKIENRSRCNLMNPKNDMLGLLKHERGNQGGAETWTSQRTHWRRTSPREVPH